MLLFTLSWRNLWRNKRRTLITISAVVFAVLLSIAQYGLQEGTYDANIRTAVRLSSGFLQLQKPGYQENPSLRKSIAFNDSLRSLLDGEPAVNGYAPRIYADGLVSFGEQSLGALLIGIDPTSDTAVFDFHKKVRSGHFLDSARPFELVVGYKLLQNLQAEIGDTVVILSQAYFGYLENYFFTIAGTMKTGADEFDRMGVFMPIEGARALLAMEGKVSAVAVSLNSLDDIPAARQRLSEGVDTSAISVLSWEQVLPDMKQMIELDSSQNALTMLLLVVVVAFGILNTLLMAITERFREFGIMLSLGMPSYKLTAVVFFEMLIMMGIGILVGNLLAAGVNYYIVLNPIELGGEFGELYAEYGFIPMLESSVKPGIFIDSTLRLALISLAATVYPLWKAYKLEPLKGIRYT